MLQALASKAPKNTNKKKMEMKKSMTMEELQMLAVEENEETAEFCSYTCSWTCSVTIGNGKPSAGQGGL